ncbi:FAD-dependent oxidoreductase [Romboutsia lituseburensis]|uniref:FAD-dependent oxidoreductase n=1 Tax=Romboutsia lituseburensis TaxID=1537 RepID=UPI0022EA53E9|nr:FAD-dependent oxidoreductase [Romboutsia lituseburensis]
MREYDLVIVGAGAAGILCAINADKNNINNVLLIEKDPILGGALTLGDYNISKSKNITGKEYKKELLKKLDNCKNIEIQLSTMVLKIDDNNEIVCTSEKNGIEKIKGKNIILANGAKEGSRKAVSMVGDRCSGILTLSMAKKIFNMDKMIPGKNILIHGDATLYMLENDLKKHNINVVGIITKENSKDTFNLTDNIYESYEITSIQGNGRLECVTLSNSKETIQINCDTLIFANPMLSDGLVSMRSNINLNPETTGPLVNENFMTSREAIFACGNGIYIHDYIEDIENECIDIINNVK